MEAKNAIQLAYESASHQARVDFQKKQVDNQRMYNSAKAEKNQRLTELQNKYHTEQNKLLHEVDECIAMRNLLLRKGYQPFSTPVEDNQRTERDLHGKLRDLKAQYQADTRQVRNELMELRVIYEANCATLREEMEQRLLGARTAFCEEMNKLEEVAEVEPETVEAK